MSKGEQSLLVSYIKDILGSATARSKQEKIDKQIIKELRQYFGKKGEIKVLYINAYELSDEATTGGIVLTDGRHYVFYYYEGEFIYRKEPL